MPKRAMRQLGLPGFELQDYVDESIAFLREHEPPEGYFVGFSGGKDSITMLELCRMAGVRHQAFYSCTRIDPPEMYSFIKRHYPDVVWLFSREPFWRLVMRNMPPRRTARWCCDYLKKRPSNAVALKHRLMGIRAEESIARKNRPRIYVRSRKQVLYKPIFHWPEWAIWEFIEAQSLPYPSLYDEGFDRIGCVICPFVFASKRRLAMYQNRWPAMWKVFEKVVKRWFVARRAAKVGINRNLEAAAQEYWQAYLAGRSVKTMSTGEVEYGQD